MEKLPLETFTSILLLLNPESRVTCALVCKSWYNLACRSLVLYETISCHDVNTCKRRYRFFSSNKHCSKSVKTLEYKLTSPVTVKDLKELPTIYPDIRHFRLSFCEDDEQTNPPYRARRELRDVQGRTFSGRPACYQGVPGEVFNGWHRLTSVEETSTQMYTLFMLNCSTTPFNHLNSLWLNFSHIKAYVHSASAVDYFFNGLKNSPQLKELALLHCSVSFDKLDVLHNYCPMLQTITLTNVTLSRYPPTKLATANVATHMKAFKLCNCFTGSAVAIIEYAGKKYPNLEDFLLEASGNLIVEPLVKSAARTFIAEATKLKSFGTNLFLLHPRFIKFMEDNGITELDKLYIGNHSDPDLPPRAEKDPYNNIIAVCNNQKFKSTLKTLTIHACKLPNGFLDCYLQLKNLTTLEVDFQANQGCEEDYMYGGCFDQEHIPEPVLSLTDLFRTLVHLKRLDLRSIVTTMDEELENLHCIEEIYIHGSHRLYTDEFGVAYSLFDFISNNCLQIQLISLYGFTTMSNAPSDYQPILDLSVHKHIARVNSSFEFYMHINEDGWPTCYSNKGTYYKKVQPADITSKHLIIKSKDRKMFWTPRTPRRIRSYYLEWDGLF
ncbi:hypothetical protein MUCCIDRAFT_107712 [Mucor lusitanicus CBS 277.49]|uniref:F-box domain-containing protein n=2 Tax=Mucor circinelloides f. lusitanicus TaxID=29924 RepID=A0A162RLQ8_MUCCL|nr:hypothetical protein MUCCIDRAFT_107712 [Mucor lusitanicus CBS 277.49]